MKMDSAPSIASISRPLKTFNFWLADLYNANKTENTEKILESYYNRTIKLIIILLIKGLFGFLFQP